MRRVLEICVEDAAGLRAAIDGGADRLEICAALDLGGLTPSAGLMRQAARCGLPSLAMIRPRPGDFCWSAEDLAVMLDDIDRARSERLAGVVLGASRADGTLDPGALEALVARAEGMDLTLHRCIDLVPDPLAALDLAIALGFDRVLTSGGARVAPEGAGAIRRLADHAAGRIAVMAGAGINDRTVAPLLDAGVAEFHASGREAVAVDPRLVGLGFAPARARRTDAGRIRALRMRLDQDGIA